MILWFFAWDLVFGIIGLEFCSLGIQLCDSVLGFVVWCLWFGMLEFRYRVLSFWVWDLDFGVWEFEFWSLRIWVSVFGFGIWCLGFGVRYLVFLLCGFWLGIWSS